MRHHRMYLAAFLGLLVLSGAAVLAAPAQERWHYVFPDANNRPTYRSMHALEEAQMLASGQGVRVGILDHGFGMDDYPELYADGVDLLGNGALTRYAEHGYWMALTLREVAPAAEIIALNTASREPMDSARAIVQAIDWAIANNVNVLSYSHPPFSAEAREIIDPAIDRAVAAGIVPVFIHYPHPDNVFPTGMWPLEEEGIGTADLNVLHYDYKLFILDNYERALERGNLRQVFLSVSSTAPVVAGVAAMMIELAPDLGPRQIEDILVATSHDVEFEGQQAPRTLDAGAAVARAAGRR